MELTENGFRKYKNRYTVMHSDVTADEYGNEQRADFHPAGAVYTMWTPVDDAAAVELYGADTEKMLRAVVYEPADAVPIEELDRVTIAGAVYSVVSVEPFLTHRRVTVKKVTREA